MFIYIATALLYCISSQGVQSNDSILPPFDMAYRAQLDEQGNYVLLWTPRDKDIVFEVQVKTKGYVGLGFSPNGRMMGADMVIGWVDDSGQVKFADRHGISNWDTPAVDESQDYEVLGGHVNETHTCLRFSRPWVTCDPTHDFPLTEDTVRVIWAYKSTRPEDPMQATMDQHEYRGVKSLLLKGLNSEVLGDDSWGAFWDVRAPEVELPGDIDTLYWCKIYKVPDLPKKHHVIGFKPLIEEAHLPHVHHMILHECMLANSSHHMEKWVQEKGAQCFSKNMPLSWVTCTTVLIGWAIGSEGEMWPKHVGFPIDEKQGGSTYFLLQIHYNNPTFKKGIVDSSGLRLFLTDNLRQYEGGILTLGQEVNPLMVIPPRMKWAAKGHCSSECTKQTLPSDGIKIFGVVLHSHLLARSIIVQHIRDGVELKPLAEDHNYDFNYQQGRTFKLERTVLPGDYLITTCYYDATKKNITTFGGFSTNDEMCLVYFSYYPRASLTECISVPDLDVVGSAFGSKDINSPQNIIMKPRDFDGNTVDEGVEEMQLKKMMEITASGQNSLNLKLANALRLINVSESESLKGNSVYDLFTRDSTWENQDMVAKLNGALNEHYRAICQVGGRITTKEIPVHDKIKSYVPYEENLSPCAGK